MSFQTINTPPGVFLGAVSYSIFALIVSHPFINADLFKVVFLFGTWLVITILLLLTASGRVLKPHFPVVARRHLVCGFVLGGLSPIFIWLINDAFDEMIRPIYLGYLSRLSEMEKMQTLGASMLELQRHFTNQSVQNWLSLRDYVKDFILIFSAGVGGNLVAGAITAWHKESDAQPISPPDAAR